MRSQLKSLSRLSPFLFPVRLKFSGPNQRKVQLKFHSGCRLMVFPLSLMRWLFLDSFLDENKSLHYFFDGRITFAFQARRLTLVQPVSTLLLAHTLSKWVPGYQTLPRTHHPRPPLTPLNILQPAFSNTPSFSYSSSSYSTSFTIGSCGRISGSLTGWKLLIGSGRMSGPGWGLRRHSAYQLSEPDGKEVYMSNDSCCILIMIVGESFWLALVWLVLLCGSRVLRTRIY